jgi:excisionase family DNA binding protein
MDDVANLLQISARQVATLRDAGEMPPPIYIGRLVRWPKSRIDAWIEQGCPRPEGDGHDR